MAEEEYLAVVAEVKDCVGAHSETHLGNPAVPARCPNAPVHDADRPHDRGGLTQVDKGHQRGERQDAGGYPVLQVTSGLVALNYHVKQGDHLVREACVRPGVYLYDWQGDVTHRNPHGVVVPEPVVPVLYCSGH